jgi:hypothetical protein
VLMGFINYRKALNSVFFEAFPNAD